MKKRMRVLTTASLAVIAGTTTYTVWAHNSSGQTEAATYKLSIDATSPNQTGWNISQIQQEITQQIQQIRQSLQQLQEQPRGHQLVSFFTNSTGQFVSQMQRLWQQQQQQLVSEWQHEPSSQTQPQGQFQPPQSVVVGQSQGQSGPSALLPLNTQASGNWSGYIDTPNASNGYTSVSGSWTVPDISGKQNGVAAQWIGLGGVASQDLLQMGTMEQFQNGQPVADIFWEKLPAAAHPVMTVPIGSTILARISRVSSGIWDITFTVKPPSGKTITKTIPVSVSSLYAQGLATSAEWISEDPSDTNNNLYPLANMGTVQYSRATVNGRGFDTSGNQVTPVALVDNYGDVLMAPTRVGSNGESFSTQTLNTGTGAGAGAFGSDGEPNVVVVPGYGYSGGWGWHHGRADGGYPAYGYGHMHDRY